MSAPEQKPPLNEATGLPGIRTWPGVYLFVLGAFLAIVVALTIFSRYFA